MFTVVMKTVSVITLLATMIIGTGNERITENRDIRPDIRSDIRISPIDGKNIPTEMNYQGYLILSADSTPVNENLNMVFELYATETGGTALWTEPHNNVQVENGIFNAILGSTTPLDPDDFTGVPLWLQTTVRGEVLSPRKKIVSSAYSVRALYSDTALYTLNIDSVIYADTSGYSFLALLADTSNYSFYGLYSDTAGYALNGNPDNDWTITGSVLYPVAQYGIAMYGNILYGSQINTHVNLGVACTTGTSGQDDDYCTVSGGQYNTSSGSYSTVAGGWYNTSSGDWSTIGGGRFNTTSYPLSTIGGGSGNTSSGDLSTIGGGDHNTSSGFGATIGGGKNNTCSHHQSTVGGGDHNTSSGAGATVGGGWYNTSSSFCSTIPGGWNVNVSGWCSFGFGRGNTATSFDVSGDYDVVFGDGDTYDYEFGINRENPSYPLHIGNGTSNGNGAYLTTGGIWTNGCSRTFKENFVKPDPYKILELVKKLDVFRYNYKGEQGIYHISPVAEDFYNLFETGNDDRYLAGLDVGGVSLLAIKALAKENEEIALRVENNSNEIIQLRRENEELRNEIDQLRADVEMLKNLNN